MDIGIQTGDYFAMRPCSPCRGRNTNTSVTDTVTGRRHKALQFVGLVCTCAQLEFRLCDKNEGQTGAYGSELSASLASVAM